MQREAAEIPILDAEDEQEVPAPSEQVRRRLEGHKMGESEERSRKEREKVMS